MVAVNDVRAEAEQQECDHRAWGRGSEMMIMMTTLSLEFQVTVSVVGRDTEKRGTGRESIS